MSPEQQPETVPNWVLTEVGRLHLHALALERALQQALAEQAERRTNEATAAADGSPRCSTA